MSLFKGPSNLRSLTLLLSQSFLPDTITAASDRFNGSLLKSSLVPSSGHDLSASLNKLPADESDGTPTSSQLLRTLPTVMQPLEMKLNGTTVMGIPRPQPKTKSGALSEAERNIRLKYHREYRLRQARALEREEEEVEKQQQKLNKGSQSDHDDIDIDRLSIMSVRGSIDSTESVASSYSVKEFMSDSGDSTRSGSDPLAYHSSNGSCSEPETGSADNISEKSSDQKSNGDNDNGIKFMEDIHAQHNLRLLDIKLESQTKVKCSQYSEKKYLAILQSASESESAMEREINNWFNEIYGIISQDLKEYSKTRLVTSKTSNLRLNEISIKSRMGLNEDPNNTILDWSCKVNPDAESTTTLRTNRSIETQCKTILNAMSMGVNSTSSQLLFNFDFCTELQKMNDETSVLGDFQKAIATIPMIGTVLDNAMINLAASSHLTSYINYMATKHSEVSRKLIYARYGEQNFQLMNKKVYDFLKNKQREVSTKIESKLGAFYSTKDTARSFYASMQEMINQIESSVQNQRFLKDVITLEDLDHDDSTDIKKPSRKSSVFKRLLSVESIN